MAELEIKDTLAIQTSEVLVSPKSKVTRAPASTGIDIADIESASGIGRGLDIHIVVAPARASAIPEGQVVVSHALTAGLVVLRLKDARQGDGARSHKEPGIAPVPMVAAAAIAGIGMILSPREVLTVTLS